MLAFLMPNITLYPIAEADAAEVLQFELENRGFFERSIAGLGDDYYNLETLKKITAKNIKAWETSDAYPYLIRDVAGELVGRVNLFGVQYGSAQKAEIGYRIAERHSGEGYAKAAVALVSREAFGTHGLHRLEGVTSPTNLASQLVLLKNGFTFWGRSRRSYLLNGVWEDCMFFERLADEK